MKLQSVFGGGKTKLLSRSEKGKEKRKTYRIKGGGGTTRVGMSIRDSRGGGGGGEGVVEAFGKISSS